MPPTTRTWRVYFYDAEHPPVEVKADTRDEVIRAAKDEIGVLVANAELIQKDVFDLVAADTPEGEKWSMDLPGRLARAVVMGHTVHESADVPIDRLRESLAELEGPA